MTMTRVRTLSFSALAALTAVGLTFGAVAQDRTMSLTPGPASEDPTPDVNDPDYILEQYPDRLPETTNQCIFFRTLYDWRPLNNTNLIVWAPTKKHPYHIQLDRPCNGLRFAHSIGFTSRDSRLCGFGGDSVLVDSSGGQADRCPIGSITKLTDESLKNLLAQEPGRNLQDKRAAEEGEKPK